VTEGFKPLHQTVQGAREGEKDRRGEGKEGETKKEQDTKKGREGAIKQLIVSGKKNKLIFEQKRKGKKEKTGGGKRDRVKVS